MQNNNRNLLPTDANLWMLTCCWYILEARGPDNSPVDVIRLLQKAFHFIHVAQNASYHGQQHEADEIGSIGARISCKVCHSDPNIV